MSASVYQVKLKEATLAIWKQKLRKKINTGLGQSVRVRDKSIFFITVREKQVQIQKY